MNNDETTNPLSVERDDDFIGSDDAGVLPVVEYANEEEHWFSDSVDDGNGIRVEVDQTVPTDINDRAMIDLIQLCNQAGTPICFFDKLMRVFKEHTDLGFNIKKAPSRSKLMDRLRSRFPYIKACEIHTQIGHIMVQKFPLIEQLKDLFATKYFQSTDYCCVNVDPASRFLQYKPSPDADEGCSEMLTGRWYKETYVQIIRDMGPTFLDPVTGHTYHNWVIPLTIYNDKTGVSSLEGSYTLEPLMFSLGVIKRSCRESADAWRHLGFIPVLSAGATDNAATSGCKTAEQSLAFTHEVLNVLLADLVELQAIPPLLTLNLFGGEMHNVRLILEVAFVIGDQLSQDTHCCRKKINGGGAGRIHRSCMTSFLRASTVQEGGCIPISKKVLDTLCDTIWLGEEAATRQAFLDITYPIPQLAVGARNPDIGLAKKNQKQLASALKTRSQVSRAILEKVFSTYPIHNAWSAVHFGANSDGIYRAALDDPMHYNASGLFKYLAEISFKSLLPAEAKKVEKFLRQDFSQRSSVRYDLPRGKFSGNFTNCTLLTASEKVGIMFSLYLGLGTPRIADIYEASILRQQRKYVDVSFCHEDSSRSSARERSRSLPLLVDKFFRNKQLVAESPDDATPVMTRTRDGVRKMVDDLNRLGLVQPLLPVLVSFDSIHTEYLLCAIWFRVSGKPDSSTVCKQQQHIPELFPDSQVDERTLIMFSNHLFSQLHQHTPDPNSSPPFPTAISCIHSNIVKHGIEKPKIKGRGDTSAILTDVSGFRQVLEYALIFHSIVHEYHQLPDDMQTNISDLTTNIDALMEYIFSLIYRGDNSIDVLTCKCHAHFHLAKDIEYFGAPMGFDASKGERNLKSWAKGISKTARKCGQQIFVRQTALRVSDHQLLQRSKSSIDSRARGPAPYPDASSLEDKEMECSKKWKYTRGKCHMTYDLRSRQELLLDCKTPSGCAGGGQLVSALVAKKLHELHGDIGLISIWKEISVNLGKGKGRHRVRSFHQFDAYGKYFDWVHTRHFETQRRGQNMTDSYRPAKVMLLYQFENEDFALVWKVRTPMDSDRLLETNLSARWTMQLQTHNGLPDLASVPTDNIERCIYVYEHWHCIGVNHLPSTVLPPGSDTSIFVIDEVYERYSWALNYLNPDRWKIGEEEEDNEG